MRFTIKLNQNVVAELDIDDTEDWLSVDINGVLAVGFDCAYSDGTYEDFNKDTTPKVVVGCWTEPEGEEWRRLAIFPLPEGPAVPVTPV